MKKSKGSLIIAEVYVDVVVWHSRGHSCSINENWVANDCSDEHTFLKLLVESK